MPIRSGSTVRLLAVGVVGLVCSGAALAEPSLTGQTGLIYMPDARIDPDGTWRSGFSYADPYSTIWTSVTALPRFEGSFRYTTIKGVPGFPDRPDADYGDYKDKAFDFKLLAFDEGRWTPSLALGAQDVGDGTGIFSAKYIALGKRIWELDFTLGYGNERIDGAFGGVRWRPGWAKNWALVAEYDANDYSRDAGAALTGVDQRRQGAVGGIEYRRGWVGLQAAYGHDEAAVNAYVSIPLQQREWMPKIDEPAPYMEITPRPSIAQWQADSVHRSRMLQALYRQDFKDVRVSLEGDKVVAVLTNVRISQMSRAVGRAARTILHTAPIETREIRIVYTVADVPFATYTFVDVKRLERYFNGLIGRRELTDYVLVEYANPGDGDLPAESDAVLAEIDAGARTAIFDRSEGDLISVRTDSTSLDRFKIAPRFSLYLNDPAGAFKYDVYAEATYDRKLFRRTFFSTAGRVTIVEDVSDVTQPSNSTLPHVRTDIAEYYRENGFKVTRMLVNRFYHPSERVYARTSAGIYELMYAGAGGQVLYLPPAERWATDLSVDWLKQRDFRGFFGFRDYETVTAIGSVHYRIPYYGLTATVRAGRFLAKDNGVRFEMKRRFASGFEVGAWYTFTDGKDITSPGSPSSPYYDKGIFATIPLNLMLTRDTQAVARGSISPWTRDVGQMVVSPADLYSVVENPLLDKSGMDGLTRLGDFDDDWYLAPPPNAIREQVSWDAFRYYVSQSPRQMVSDKALLGGIAAVGLVGLSYAADDDVDKWAREHKDDRANKAMADAGRLLPLGMLGASALAAMDRDDPRLSRTAVTALQSAGIGLGASLGLNYAAGRAKPEAGTGKGDFEPFDRGRELTAFPSDLTTVAWATVTPFAKEYDAPWLYGLAAITNLGRIAERRHWLSDTVAGAAIGYGVGSLMWHLNREREKHLPQIALTPDRVYATWEY
ncbi:MAG TPA: YjbH domain-containing protein [Burkholderiales bacterium]|nr:YjbH domain-containing protein [Burkholderiales bacterium]